MSGFCCRCLQPHAEFRVKDGDVWPEVCGDCVMSGEQVWVDLPNGQLVGDVAPEVNQ